MNIILLVTELVHYEIQFKLTFLIENMGIAMINMTFVVSFPNLS